MARWRGAPLKDSRRLAEGVTMFATHQPIIAAHAESPEGFRRVVRFVHLTIQEPLLRMPEHMRRVESGDHGPLWGHKGAADAWWSAHYREAHAQLLAQWAPEQRLATLATLPGLGLAKAGFVCQLAWGTVGCLDSHNLKRWGIPASITTMGKRVKRATAIERATRYAAACRRLGGCEYLWDSWCEHVAANSRASGGLDAEGISALHVTALGLSGE